MPRKRTRSRRTQQAQATGRANQSARIPAPQGGLDKRIAPAANDMNTCVYTYNMVPDEFGMRIRRGYREHMIGVDNGLNSGVNTIIPFNAPDCGNSMLFAANNEGIWDVTTEAGTPTLKVAFADVFTEGAGFGDVETVAALNGISYIFYADSVNGLFRYQDDTDVWAAPADITHPVGLSDADVIGVVKHKLRIWLFYNNGKAVYLGQDAISGATTEFNFTDKFKRGGTIRAGYNWTIDGGDGVDDYFVIVGSQGDVLPYRGTDPSAAATWELVGNYYVGCVPPGANVGYTYAGELYLVGSFGLVAMSDLLRGVETSNTPATSIGFRIADLIQRDMETQIGDVGWSMTFLPQDDILLLVRPKAAGAPHLQYAFNVTVRGWGTWRDVPMNSVAAYKNRAFFGTADGRIMVMDVAVDNQTIADPSPALNGDDITFSLLTNYSDAGAPGVHKQVVTIRPDFLAQSVPSYSTKALYDYQQQEFTGGVLAGTNPVGALWDNALWDIGIWTTGNTLQPFSNLRGATGYGRTIAVAVRGSARSEVALASIDLAYLTGGVL